MPDVESVERGGDLREVYHRIAELVVSVEDRVPVEAQQVAVLVVSPRDVVA